MRSNVPSCIELVKGLHQCEADVKAMNLRALLANSELLEQILEATWKIIITWLDWPCSGLSDDEHMQMSRSTKEGLRQKKPGSHGVALLKLRLKSC